MHNLATHTWAPTVVWVASRNQYAIVYSANNGADVFMANYTSDFRTVSAHQVYFSPGFPVLDADIVTDGSNYYMYYKNLSNGLIYGARSSTGAPNSYTTYTSGLRQGNAIEAPLLIKNNTGSGWRLWGDSFSPVNRPGRYLRHSDYAIRLDANDGTATFRGDATFLRVAGLADPTLVVVPVRQLPGPLPAPRQLCAPHRPAELEFQRERPAGRHVPSLLNPRSR